MISDKYTAQWRAAEARIADGIERHRKSDVTVRVVDAAGRPIAGKAVAIEQASSSFLFGANLFMVNGFETTEMNERFERAYTELFNSGSVAMYWRDLEPTPGALRFSADSPPIHRRPPVDVAVNFGKKHGLNLNGHLLVWDFAKWFVPDWLDDETSQTVAPWDRRISQIAERYGSVIERWDVLNEYLATPWRKTGNRAMPPNYERMAFELAAKYLPASAFLMINETTGASWYGDLQKYSLLIGRLIANGARIDGVGMQFHLFNDPEVFSAAAGEKYTPADLFNGMDTLAAHGRSLHVSEITLPSPRGEADGLQLQATLAQNFYRLWFSHPAVHAITWWNVPDGGAAPGEGGVDSGLLDASLRPKPAYRALHQLIKDEWRTRLTATTNAAGEITFRGFHGGYQASIDGSAGTFELLPQGGNAVVTLGEAS